MEHKANCTEFEELIALHVEDDLTARERSAVEAHLANCAACRRFADELRESQASLKVFGMVDFNEDYLDDLHHAVMRRLPREVAAPPWWERLFGGFGRRYAFAALLLVVALSPVAWLVLKDSNPKGNPVARIPSIESPAVSPEAVKSPAGVPVHQPSAEPIRVRRHVPRFAKHRLPVQIADLRPTPELPSVSVETLLSQAPVEKVRLEIQTKDPNVRIIWLMDKQPSQATLPGPGSV